jgi:hypothetical protein
MEEESLMPSTRDLPPDAPQRGDHLPPLVKERTYEPRPDRSGVERKSDERLGRELDEQADREVERVKGTPHRQ